MARKKKTTKADETAPKAEEPKVEVKEAPKAKKPKKDLYICNRPKLHIGGRHVPYNEPFEADEWKGKQFKNALRIGAIEKVK